MATHDPQTVAQRWAANLGAATQKITDGVNAVTVAPGQKAARQKAVWLQNTQSAADKWAANTAAVSLNSWQTAMTSKGVNRIASGAQAAESKMAAFLTAFLPAQASIVAGLPPRGGLEQNIARSAALIRATAAWKRPATAR